MIQPTTPPFVVRPAAASVGMEDGQSGRSSAGSTNAAAVHALMRAIALEGERNPSLESLRAERDPRLYDATFYTGLGRELAERIQWEIDRAALRK